MTRTPAGGDTDRPARAALYLGAVLGTGVTALPAPPELPAWPGPVPLSAPLAATFTALGAWYPEGGGGRLVFLLRRSRRCPGGTAADRRRGGQELRVSVSRRLQLALAVLLVALLPATVLAALPRTRLRNPHPFAPRGWSAIGSAGAAADVERGRRRLRPGAARAARRHPITEHRFDVVQSDVAKCGGFTEARAATLRLLSAVPEWVRAHRLDDHSVHVR
ncbi:hypothetical protein [Streptomyces camelliae]|uniref:Uncharacterized protein n=1 Tax=Streptomyces camelliae TaxID=3004093 RepID=A0ABY7PEI4_9ACTN|nr:hypothetical protein [Streptomyces sp. HUAS 2-6]WBO68580.1 hypothetical protein O1G22_40090 [Streptomyces sp. HUAS 2-6]